MQNGNAPFDMGVRDAWRLGFTGRGVVVGIIDSGILHKHPEIQPNYVNLHSINNDQFLLLKSSS